MFALRYCIVWAVYIFLGLSGLRAEGGSLAHWGGGGSSLTLGFSYMVLIWCRYLLFVIVDVCVAINEIFLNSNRDGY